MHEETMLESQLEKEKEKSDSVDVIVIGAGPAGMSAALCAARANLDTILMDKALPGGEASTAYHVDNYLGFPGGVLGTDLASMMESHIQKYPIEFICDSIEDILNPRAKEKIVKTELGKVYKAKYIIIAVGLEPKKLNHGFEKKFFGRGISYYAQCDGETYKGKEVAVMGGGNCACYAAEFLSSFVEKLYLIHSTDSIKAVKHLKEKVLHNPKVVPVWDSEVEEVFGMDRLEKIKLRNHRTNQTTWLDIKALFVYIGRIPPENQLCLEIDLDEDGFVITDEYMRTNIPGIYAAGDIRSKQIRQIATAVSDGMVAAINVGKEISD